MPSNLQHVGDEYTLQAKAFKCNPVDFVTRHREPVRERVDIELRVYPLAQP